ncbi:MAG: hypothetical protein EOT04_01240 [Candidatus Chaera renei]|uniref:Type IV pilus assembly protein PilN n=1 Tax=Candidatus Chaera renei TaxID=2506947 RepID=A0A4Q0AJ62_9BACT|nr:MAG: hypothetical protein EOT04_01240 [Candidatus Chaera renei]
MIELNLLPDVKKEFLKAQQTRNSVITASFLISAATLGLVVSFAVFVYAVQPVQTKLLTDEIKKNQQAIESIPDISKYLTVQSQLSQLSQLHTEKTVYGRMIDFLSTLNPSPPNNVQLTGLQLTSADSSVIFTGTAGSFEAFNVFKDTLLNAEVTYQVAGAAGPVTEKLLSGVEVQASNLGNFRNNQVVNFVVKATYNKTALTAQAGNTSVKVPSIETTQSVRQAPQPLFNGGTP